MIDINVERRILTSGGYRKLMIDIKIPPRELIVLFGHSGAGKTTLLRMVAGLVQPDKGMIKIGNTVVFDSYAKINLSPQKRKIGFMFQDYGLFPNMSVEQNIGFAQTKDKKLVDQLIGIFGLHALRKQKPSKLSGGQKQRVALARSLAQRPDILLLDEPLSSLDEEMRLSLQSEILKAHQIFGATTLMVSHDSKEVKRMATHVLCVGKEKINKLHDPTFL